MKIVNKNEENNENNEDEVNNENEDEGINDGQENENFEIKRVILWSKKMLMKSRKIKI